MAAPKKTSNEGAVALAAPPPSKLTTKGTTKQEKIETIEIQLPEAEKSPSKRAKAVDTVDIPEPAPTAKKTPPRPEKSVEPVANPSKACAEPLPISTPHPTHEEIAARAFEIYLSRSCTPGNPEEDWLQAENELINPR